MLSESSYTTTQGRLRFKVRSFLFVCDMRYSCVWIEISNNTGMTVADIVATLQFNGMLKKTQEGYELVNEGEQGSRKPGLYAKSELLTWVPYMAATKGDAGILNIPREHTHRSSFDKGRLASSDISTSAIIPTSKRRKTTRDSMMQKRSFRSSTRRSLTH